MSLPIAGTPPDTNENDLLTQELAGLGVETGTSAKQIEEPGAQPRPLAEQLDSSIPTPTALRPSPTPRAQAADKVHSVAAGGAGYRVVIMGDYKRATPQGPELKDYDLPFNLPFLVDSKGAAALGIIVNASHPENSLLQRALKKKDPNFKSVHTHFIKSVTPLHGAPPPTSLQYMGKEALAQYALSRQLGIDPEQYWDVEHLRADIIYLVTNKADNVDARTGLPLSEKIKDGKGLGVKNSPLEIIKARHQERIDAKALLDMNDGLGDENTPRNPPVS
jgi:hypothetical protein